MEWIISSDFIYGKHGKIKKFTKSSKVVAFDLDHTIVKPIAGKRFSETADDWELYDSIVYKKLNQYHKDKYTIVILSNQKGISMGKVNPDVWKQKIENIANKINVPFIILASLKDNIYRKPRIGLWDKFVKCSKKRSFYCGDAGGLGKRKIKGHAIKKDFSDSDLKFALNAGLKFIHRDEFIYDVEQPIDPKYVDIDSIDRGEYEDFEPDKSQEMIINIGYPGSGKSFYSKRYIVPHGYAYINRDTLKTQAKCKKFCDQALKDGKSVVIDNTNPDVKSREQYISIAQKYKIKIRCVMFTTSYDLSMHNNIYRGIMSNNKIKIVPVIAYRIYRKKLTKPSKSEGFSEIIKMDFILDEDEVTDTYFSYLY